jgi:hypothetical protein
MPGKHIIFLCILILIKGILYSQDGMVRTKEGRSILSKRELVTNCLKSFHKDRSDATTFSICECQVNKMDLHFTSNNIKDIQPMA